MSNPVKPKAAASLVIIRNIKNKAEVLMGQRPKTAKFAPNVWVFPGGRVEESDCNNKKILITFAKIPIKRGVFASPAALREVLMTIEIEKAGVKTIRTYK